MVDSPDFTPDDQLRDEPGSPWAGPRHPRRREHLAAALFRPLFTTGFAALLTAEEPFVAIFIGVDLLVWLAAAVDWWQFAMDRIGPGWRAKWRGRNG